MKNTYYNLKITATLLNGEKIEIFNYEHDFTNLKSQYQDVEVGMQYCYQTFEKNGTVYLEGDYDEPIPLIDVNDCQNIFNKQISESMRKVLEINELDVKSIAKINTFEEIEIPEIMHRYKRNIFIQGQDNKYHVHPLQVKFCDAILAHTE